MIVLDTNVILEAMKPDPDDRVRAWLDAQSAETLYLSAVSVAGLSFGVSAPPAGKRKAALSSVLEGVLSLFEARILAFDIQAAGRYGDLAAKAREAGRGFPTPDGYIAAIAAANGFIVATHNGSAFEAAGLKIIDPWS
jgi:predicted nucleic acid-binding protein